MLGLQVNYGLGNQHTAWRSIACPKTKPRAPISQPQWTSALAGPEEGAIHQRQSATPPPYLEHRLRWASCRDVPSSKPPAVLLLLSHCSLHYHLAPACEAVHNAHTRQSTKLTSPYSAAQPEPL